MPPVRVVRPSRGDGDARPAAAPAADVTRLPSYQEAFELGRQAGFAAGHAEGVQAGHAEGMGQARQQAEVEARARADADARERATRDQRYATVAASIESSYQAALAQVRANAQVAESQLVGLAVDLARELLGRELELVDEPARLALERALRLAPDGVDVIAHLNPVDVGVADWSRPGLQVVADPHVELGGCVLHAGATTVDAQISTALGRLAAAVAELGRTEHAPTAPDAGAGTLQP